MKLILIGPPGSGKGTVAEKLEKEFSLFHVSPGELLREEVKKGTTIGKEIKKYIEKGELVPDQFVVEMVKLEVKGKKNYILDGFPRSLDQAKEIEDLQINHVLYFEIDEKEVVKRLGGRRVCEKGLHNYHLAILPPKHEGKCDIDGSALIQRKDDSPKAIKERFRVFHKETMPVIRYYQKKGILGKIDASSSPKRVYEKVKKLIK